MRRPLALALLVTTTAALAGCAGGNSNDDTSGDFKGEQQQVANVVEDFQTAGEKRDGTKICRDYISAGLQQQIAAKSGPKGCGDGVKNIVKDTDQSDLTVRSVTIDPSDAAKASAVVKQKLGDHKSRDVTLGFVKQGGDWRIDTLGGQ